MVNAITQDIIGELQEGFSQLSSAIAMALENVNTVDTSHSRIRGINMGLCHLERQDQVIQEVLRTNSRLDALLSEIHAIPGSDELRDDIRQLLRGVDGAIEIQEKRVDSLRARLDELTFLLSDVNSYRFASPNETKSL